MKSAENIPQPIPALKAAHEELLIESQQRGERQPELAEAYQEIYGEEHSTHAWHTSEAISINGRLPENV